MDAYQGNDQMLEWESWWTKDMCDERYSEWLVGVFENGFGTQRNTNDGVKRNPIRWGASTNGALYIPRYVDTGNNRITS